MVGVAGRDGQPRAGERIAAGTAQQNQAGRPALVQRIRARASGAPGVIGAGLMNRAARRIGLARVRHGLASAIQRRWLSRAEDGRQSRPEMPYVQRYRLGLSRTSGNNDPLQPGLPFGLHPSAPRWDWASASRPAAPSALPIGQPGPAMPARYGAQPVVLPVAPRRAASRQGPPTPTGHAPADLQAQSEAGAASQPRAASPLISIRKFSAPTQLIGDTSRPTTKFPDGPLAASEDQAANRRAASATPVQPARPQPGPPTGAAQNGPGFDTRALDLPVRALHPQPALGSAGRLGQAIARQYQRPAIQFLRGVGAVTGPAATSSLVFLRRAKARSAIAPLGDSSSSIAASRAPGHSGPVAPVAGTVSRTVANRLPIAPAEQSPTAVTRRQRGRRTQLAHEVSAGAGDFVAAQRQPLAQTGARTALALPVDNQSPARVFAKPASPGPTLPMAARPAPQTRPAQPAAEHTGRPPKAISRTPVALGVSIISARSLPVEGEQAVGRPISPRAVAVRRQIGRPVAAVSREVTAEAAGADRFGSFVRQPVLRRLSRRAATPHRTMPAARDEASVMRQLRGTGSAPGLQTVLALATARPGYSGAAPVAHLTATRASAAQTQNVQGAAGANSMQPAIGLPHAPSISAAVESQPRPTTSERLSTQAAAGGRSMHPRAVLTQPMRLAHTGVRPDSPAERLSIVGSGKGSAFLRGARPGIAAPDPVATLLRRAVARGGHVGADSLGSWIVQRLQPGAGAHIGPWGGAFPGLQFDGQRPVVGSPEAVTRTQAAADAVGGLAAQPLLTRHATIARRAQVAAMPGSGPNTDIERRRANELPTPGVMAGGAQGQLAWPSSGGAGARSPMQATPLSPAPDMPLAQLARPAAGPVHDNDPPRQTQGAAFDWPIGGAIQRATTNGAAGPVANDAPVAGPAAAAQPDFGSAGAALNQLDLERVAREVYTLIERRLVFEREVMGL